MEDETRAEVAENAEPETEKEQTEQREDDYQGLARCLEDALEMLSRISDKLDDLEGMYSTFVDAGAIVTGATDAVALAAAEGVAEALEDALNLETLDYVL